MQRFYKKAAAYVLRAVAKHSPELSQSVVASGGVDALVLCLEEFDPGVKEAAAWALGYIARHNACKEDTLMCFNFYYCLITYILYLCLFSTPLCITVQCWLSLSWMRVLCLCW